MGLKIGGNVDPFHFLGMRRTASGFGGTPNPTRETRVLPLIIACRKMGGLGDYKKSFFEG